MLLDGPRARCRNRGHTVLSPASAVGRAVPVGLGVGSFCDFSNAGAGVGPAEDRTTLRVSSGQHARNGAVIGADDDEHVAGAAPVAFAAGAGARRIGGTK